MVDIHSDSSTDGLSEFQTVLYEPTLLELAEVLQNGMQPLFHERQVDIVSCPCLTEEPYNLVGVGLCGQPAILEFGDTDSLVPWHQRISDINDILSKSCRDCFIIGSSYAAKSHMPYNGHLIMNAMYRTPTNITNASRIVFADSGNGQRRIEAVTNPNQMICSFRGSFFISEGRPGHVLRIRAKGRRTANIDIITSIQTILCNYYNPTYNILALGGVLRMRNGRAACNIMSDDFPEYIVSFQDFLRRYQCNEIDLESDLIAVGTLFNYNPVLLGTEQRYGLNLYDREDFHSFSNYGAGGQFISDTTPDITEYEGYFNIASKYTYIEID